MFETDSVKSIFSQTDTFWIFAPENSTEDIYFLASDDGEWNLYIAPDGSASVGVTVSMREQDGSISEEMIDFEVGNLADFAAKLALAADRATGYFDTAS